MRKIEVGKKYKHFKGHVYTVIAIGYDSEKYNEDNPEESLVVVYQNVESKEVWVRPYEDFVSEVDHKKYPKVKQKYRFQEVRIKSLNNK